MNSVILSRQSGGELKKKFHSDCDDDFYDLIEYLVEGDRWSKLIDPWLNRQETTYACGNFYCTRLEGANLLITDFHQLDINDYDDVKPVIINQNTAYDLACVFNIMRYNKVQEFTVTQEGEKYTVTAANLDPFVFDPDLGVIYNDMIPRITVKVTNNLLEGTIKTKYLLNSIYNAPTHKHVQIFYDVFVKDLSLSQATVRYKQLKDLIETNIDKTLIYNNVKISIEFGYFRMIPIEQDHPNFISLNLSPYSVLKLLEAWESRLQFCDSFTLVFLGETLRFFEGEPL